MNTKAILPILLPLLAALLVNAAIFALGWNGDAAGTSMLDPPGALIGAVWTILLCLMGSSLWQSTRLPAARQARLPPLIVLLIVLCLSYPFYTRGLQSSTIGLIGNAITFIYATVVTVRAWPVSRKIAGPLVPVLFWLVYASLITTHKLHNGA